MVVVQPSFFGGEPLNPDTPEDEDPDADFEGVINDDEDAEKSSSPPTGRRGRGATRSRALPASLEDQGPGEDQRGDKTLRWILVHMVEETARHAGHADIIRELIDGRTGY